MPVGLLTLELHIPDAQSLKDKRQVLRSLKDKLRREFNVAVAELDHQDVWQRSVVGVVTLSAQDIVFAGEQTSIASLDGMYERTIPAYTFSKSYAMTGLRLGYLAIHDEAIRERTKDGTA